MVWGSDLGLIKISEYHSSEIKKNQNEKKIRISWSCSSWTRNIYKSHASRHQRENMSTGSIHQHFDLAPKDIEQMLKSTHNSKSEQI